MRRIVVPEKEHRIRPPFGEAPREDRVPQSPEVARPGPRGAVGHELGVVTGKQVHIPGQLDAEFRVPLVCHAKVPQIEHPEFDRRMGVQPAKPRTIVLRGMREHHREPKRPRRVHT